MVPLQPRERIRGQVSRCFRFTLLVQDRGQIHGAN